MISTCLFQKSLADRIFQRGIPLSIFHSSHDIPGEDLWVMLSTTGASIRAFAAKTAGARAGVEGEFLG